MSNTNTSNKKRSQWVEVWRRLKRNKMAVLGLIILIILVLLAVFADVIANYDNVVIKQNLAHRLQDQVQHTGLEQMSLVEIYLQDLYMEQEYHYK